MKRIYFKLAVSILICMILITSTNVLSLADYVLDEVVNLGVAIELKSEKSTVKSGEIHKVSIKSSYANPNDEDYAKCRVYLTNKDGSPNTDVELLGLVDNSIIFACKNNEDLSVEVNLKEEKDQDESITARYIEYILPPGTTVEMEFEFIVPNGITEPDKTLILTGQIEHTKHKTENNDKVGDPLELKWESSFVWENFEKTSNAENIKINTNNKFEKNIKYSFSAENVEDTTGIVWANGMVLSDELTLPDGITLPEGEIAAKNGNICIGDKVIYTISLPNTYTRLFTNLGLENNKLSFDLEILNPNVEEGKILADFNPLDDLEIILNTGELIISDTYASDGTDEIKNRAELTIYPCVANLSPIALNSETTTTILEDVQEITLTKTVNKIIVEKDDIVTYTVTIRNNGRLGVTQTFSDTIPEDIVLTDESIENLTNAGFTIVGNTITKQITINSQAEKVIEYNVKVNTDNGKNIRNTANYGDLNTTATITVEGGDYEIGKELTSRNISYYVENDSNTYTLEKCKITSGERLNYIGPGDLIEYTIFIKNNSTVEKNVYLKDVSPAVASGAGLYSMSNTTDDQYYKYGMLGTTDFPIGLYGTITNAKTDFVNNGVNLVNFWTGSFSIVVPPETTYEQTFLLKIGKTVEQGETYDESYDKLLDVMRYNSGFAANPNATPVYSVPYNYIYDENDSSKTAIIYQKMEPRYYVSKGVLARTNVGETIAQEDMWLTGLYGKNLKQHSISKDEVITFYAYFVNDTMEELDMSETVITDHMPEQYEFLGYRTFPSTGLTIDSQPSALQTYTRNTSTIFWVNDARGEGKYNINGKYQINKEKENNTIAWEYSEVDSNIQFIPTGTLKPGQGCYIIYSYKNTGGNENDFNTSIDWNFGTLPFITKSNSITTDTYFTNEKSTTKLENAIKNKNSGLCERKDYNTITSSIRLEVENNKKASIQKTLLDSSTAAPEGMVDGVHTSRVDTRWKVIIKNESEDSSIDVSKIIEIVDSPLAIQNGGYTIRNEYGSSIGGGSYSAQDYTEIQDIYSETKTVTRRRYEISLSGSGQKTTVLLPKCYIEINLYTLKDPYTNTLGHYYNTAILPIDTDEATKCWDFSENKMAPENYGCTGIMDSNFISMIGAYGKKYYEKDSTEEIHISNGAYIKPISQENEEMNFTLELNTNVGNLGQATITKLKNIVLYDLLPDGGYSINPQSFYAYIRKSNGTIEEIPQENYTVEYSSEDLLGHRHPNIIDSTKDDTYNMDFDKAKTDIWQNEYTNDCTSFRIVFDENFEVNSNCRLYVNYKAIVRDDISYYTKYGNMFGYMYDAVRGDSTIVEGLNEETARLYVSFVNGAETTAKKQVRDLLGNLVTNIEPTYNKSYTFDIYSLTEVQYNDKTVGTKIGEFELNPGEEKTISEIEAEANVAFTDGYYYYISERDTEGIEKQTTVENATDRKYYLDEGIAFKYEEYEKNFQIVFTNNILKRGNICIIKENQDGKPITFDNTIMKFKILDANENEVNFLNGYYVETPQEGSVTEIETSTNNINIGNLPEGKYYYVETRAPEGYELNTDPIEFNITSDDYTEKDSYLQNIEIQNTYSGADATLNIEKRDSESNELITIDSAEFRVVNYDNNSEQVKFVRVENNEGENLYRVATVEDAEPLEVIETVNGKVKITGLDYETQYKVEETKAPWGYETNETVYDVTLGSTSAIEQTLAVPNVKTVSSIVINKKDYANALIEESAEFELRDNEGSLMYFEKLENSGDSANYRLLKEQTENSTNYVSTYKGKVTIIDLPRNMEFVLTEKTAPEGYMRTDAETNISFTATQTAKEYTIKNGKSAGEVVITKTDTDGNIIVDGKAVFALYNENDELIRTSYVECDGDANHYTITENNEYIRLTTCQGKIRITELPVGKYYLKEVVAPKGYSLYKEKINFEIKEDSYINPVNVEVRNPDYIFGEEQYVSSSYQKISEKDETDNYGYGYNGKESDYGEGNYNYIYVDDVKDTITYTLRVANMSKKNFERLVLINKLPDTRDTGVVNLNEARNSEFSVSMASNPNFKVLVKGLGDENELGEGDYTVEYSDSTEFTNRDWDGLESDKWYGEAKASTKSFRVTFKEGFELYPTYDMEVNFDGAISEEAEPGEIAWNSFGYRYYVGNSMLTPEPPKVGVKIPYEPYITKNVTDGSNGMYSFDIYEKGVAEKITTIEIEAGTETVLPIKKVINGEEEGYIEAGKTYIIKEQLNTYAELESINGNEHQTEYEITYKRGEESSVIFVNKPYEEGRIIITKKDKETGEPIKGVKFEIKDERENTLKLTEDGDGYKVSENGEEELVTDEEGKIVIRGLKFGTYTIIEKETPVGYKEGENHTVTISQEDYKVVDNSVVNVPEKITIENEKKNDLPNSATPTPEVTATPTPDKTPEATATPTPEKTPGVTATPTPEKTPGVTATPTPDKTPEVTATPTPDKTPGVTATPTPEKTPGVTATPTPEKTPEVTVTPKPEVTPRVTVTPTQGKTPEATSTTTPTKTAVPTLSPINTPQKTTETELIQKISNGIPKTGDDTPIIAITTILAVLGLNILQIILSKKMKKK